MQIASVYNVLKSFSDWLENVVKFITAILILLCSITVFLQVVNRYILVKQTLFEWESISWTDELARLLMVSLDYFAMGMCYKHGQLSRADMVYTRLKGCSKKVLYYIETPHSSNKIWNRICFGECDIPYRISEHSGKYSLPDSCNWFCDNALPDVCRSHWSCFRSGRAFCLCCR